MSSPGQGLQLQPRKVSYWNRALGFSFKEFFSALGSATVYGVAGQWADCASSLWKASTEVKLKNKPEHLAWLLILRSLLTAIDDLIKERRNLLRPEERSLKGLEVKLGDKIEELEISITPTIFDAPQSLPLLDALKEPLRSWLIGAGMYKAEAENAVHCLPPYFLSSLNQEWTENKERYKPLKEVFDTPFFKAIERESAWRNYSSWLKRFVAEPLLGRESFGLQEIYIEPRVYRLYDGLPELTEPTFRELEIWLATSDKWDAIRVVTGGPGSGKTSLAKMFAACQADHDYRVVFLSLESREMFESVSRGQDFKSAIEKVVEDDLYLPRPLFHPKHPTEKILLILDGFESLVMQGQLHASDVIERIKSLAEARNNQKLRLKLLLTARTALIQNLRDVSCLEAHQILYLMPYQLSKREQERFDDDKDIIRIDQRQQCWQRFGELTGQNYDGLPEVLDRDELLPITGQPLWNYLLAKKYLDKPEDFSGEINLHRMYGTLIHEIFQPDPVARRHPALRDIDNETFFLLLKEVALVVWHTGQAAKAEKIGRRCKDVDPQSFARVKGDQAKFTQVLSAFHLQRQGNGGNPTYKFVHDIFGEYFAAERIVATIETIEQRHGSVWTDDQSLVEWAKMCGPSTLSEEGWQFVEREIVLRFQDGWEDAVERWQNLLARLFGFMLEKGMPMEGLELPTYRETVRQARNAEEALLIACSACAMCTGNRGHIQASTMRAFGDWLARGRGFGEASRLLVLKRLRYFSLQDQNLRGCDLSQADLSGADLRNVILERANLSDVNLEKVDLTGATNLRETKLKGTILNGARLQEAKLQRADLRDAELVGADLRDSNLESADLQSANLTRAKLQGAELKGANLASANLQGANLIDASLGEADLRSAKLQGAKLRGAYLWRANLRRAVLTEAEFDLEQLIDAKIEGCTFSDPEVHIRIQTLREEDFPSRDDEVTS